METQKFEILQKKRLQKKLKKKSQVVVAANQHLMKRLVAN
jgi:hypothetical protein